MTFVPGEAACRSKMTDEIKKEKRRERGEKGGKKENLFSHALFRSRVYTYNRNRVSQQYSFFSLYPVRRGNCDRIVAYNERVEMGFARKRKTETNEARSPINFVPLALCFVSFRIELFERSIFLTNALTSSINRALDRGHTWCATCI